MSHPDENIDPSLLALDPTNDLLARIRSGSSSAPGTPPAGDDDDTQDVPQDSSNQGTEPPSNTADGSPSSSSSSLVAYGRLVKRKMNLSETTSVAFDQFCEVRHCFILHSTLVIYMPRPAPPMRGKLCSSRMSCSCSSCPRKMTRQSSGPSQMIFRYVSPPFSYNCSRRHAEEDQ
jgi:hypothetical protein